MKTENEQYSIPEQALTTAVILVVLAIVLVLMLAASWVHRFIGNSGASIISRVMGLILSSVAVDSVLNGIKDYFQL